MTNFEDSPDEYCKISIWFRLETVEILQRIQQANHLGVLEDAIDWLIQGWQINQHQQFSWEFNQCRRPKYWFGQFVKNKITGRVGQVTGIQWCREGTIPGTPGFWYAVERSSLAAHWMSEVVLETSDTSCNSSTKHRQS